MEHGDREGWREQGSVEEERFYAPMCVSACVRASMSRASAFANRSIAVRPLAAITCIFRSFEASGAGAGSSAVISLKSNECNELGSISLRHA